GAAALEVLGRLLRHGKRCVQLEPRRDAQVQMRAVTVGHHPQHGVAQQLALEAVLDLIEYQRTGLLHEQVLVDERADVRDVRAGQLTEKALPTLLAYEGGLGQQAPRTELQHVETRLEQRRQGARERVLLGYRQRPAELEDVGGYAAHLLDEAVRSQLEGRADYLTQQRHALLERERRQVDGAGVLRPRARPAGPPDPHRSGSGLQNLEELQQLTISRLSFHGEHQSLRPALSAGQPGEQVAPGEARAVDAPALQPRPGLEGRQVDAPEYGVVRPGVPW